MVETVAAVCRVLLRGSSFPSVVRTTTGRRFVMKLSAAGPGRRALATEYVALRLARSLSLNVPDVAVLHLPSDLPWLAGTDEFYEAVQRSAGLNLGVGLVPDAVDLKAADLASMPGEFASRLGGIDALLQNVDRTAANPNVVRDRSGAHWAIDFGACLLIDRLARGVVDPRLGLPSNHFLSGSARPMHSIRALAAAIEEEHLAATVSELPEAWLEELALPREKLLSRLKAYLESIRAT